MSLEAIVLIQARDEGGLVQVVMEVEVRFRTCSWGRYNRVRLNMAYERKGGVRDEFKVFGLSSWKDEGTIYWEDYGRNRFWVEFDFGMLSVKCLFDNQVEMMGEYTSLVSRDQGLAV